MTDDTIATVRLAGSEIDRARRAQAAAVAHPEELAWVALLMMHLGALSECFATGDGEGAMSVVRKMQADLEACKQEIAA